MRFLGPGAALSFTLTTYTGRPSPDVATDSTCTTPFVEEFSQPRYPSMSSSVWYEFQSIRSTGREGRGVVERRGRRVIGRGRPLSPTSIACPVLYPYRLALPLPLSPALFSTPIACPCRLPLTFPPRPAVLPVLPVLLFLPHQGEYVLQLDSVANTCVRQRSPHTPGLLLVHQHL